MCGTAPRQQADDAGLEDEDDADARVKRRKLFDMVGRVKLGFAVRPGKGSSLGMSASSSGTTCANSFSTRWSCIRALSFNAEIRLRIPLPRDGVSVSEA